MHIGDSTGLLEIKLSPNARAWVNDVNEGRSVLTVRVPSVGFESIETRQLVGDAFVHDWVVDLPIRFKPLEIVVIDGDSDAQLSSGYVMLANGGESVVPRDLTVDGRARFSAIAAGATISAWSPGYRVAKVLIDDGVLHAGVVSIRLSRE